MGKKFMRKKKKPQRCKLICITELLQYFQEQKFKKKLLIINREMVTKDMMYIPMAQTC